MIRDMYASFNAMVNDGELARARFFQFNVHMDVWKNAMSGENEMRVIDLLDTLGYILDKDFVRQHPVGERYVIDIAFVNERFALEVDGESHKGKDARRKDKIRDKYLRSANWVTLRIPDEDLFGEKASFYKFLIHEIVQERREQWNKGVVRPVDFKRFQESDYE